MKINKVVAEDRIDDIVKRAKKDIFKEPKPELPTLKAWLRKAHEHLLEANQILINLYNVIIEIEEKK